MNPDQPMTRAEALAARASEAQPFADADLTDDDLDDLEDGPFVPTVGGEDALALEEAAVEPEDEPLTDEQFAHLLDVATDIRQFTAVSLYTDKKNGWIEILDHNGLDPETLLRVGAAAKLHSCELAFGPSAMRGGVPHLNIRPIGT